MTSRRVLTLREFETATIGQQWMPEQHTVPVDFVDAVDRLQGAYGASVVSCGRRSLRTANWVGTVNAGGRVLDILPKTDQPDNALARQQLVTMLVRGRCVPSLELGNMELRPFPTLLDAFMLVYVRRLAQEWRRGRIRNYRKLEANRLALRGKLLPAEQVRRNLVHPERFYTRADEFIEDGPIPRLLKSALLVCLRFGVFNEVQREAAELLADFELVAEVMWDRQALDRLTVDRRFKRFDFQVNLAKMLVVHAVPDQCGRASTYSLLFDMNIVFERYIGAMLQYLAGEMGFHVRLQAMDDSLLIRHGRRTFGLKPDVAIYVKERLVCLVDTKWKVLNLSEPHEGVTAGDMYQAYAYGKEYACPRVVLLYPRVAGLGPNIADYRHKPGADDSARIIIATVDVGQSATSGSDSVASQLREMLQSQLSRGRAD